MTSTARPSIRFGSRPDDLAALFEHGGPFLTVYLTAEGAVEDAHRRNRLRWQALRDRLGDDQPSTRDVEAIVLETPLKGGGLVVIATERDVIHVERTETPPRSDLGRWAALPSLIPLLAAREALVSHVDVAIDRRGANISLDTGGDGIEQEIEGREQPIRKVKPGGWSQRRFQQRAENTWRDNAANVADALARLVDVHDPRVVFVSGDLRAIELLRKSLPQRVLDRVQVLDGGERGHGPADAELDAQMRRLLATIPAADTVALLRDFEREVGQVDRAVNGPHDTVAALGRGQVEMLLVPDDPTDTRVAWFGRSPLAVALEPEVLRNEGVGDPVRGRLADVLVRAALGSGAGVRVVPKAGPVLEGAGAMLRWA